MSRGGLPSGAVRRRVPAALAASRRRREGRRNEIDERQP